MAVPMLKTFKESLQPCQPPVFSVKGRVTGPVATPRSRESIQYDEYAFLFMSLQASLEVRNDKHQNQLDLDSRKKRFNCASKHGPLRLLRLRHQPDRP
jgi:hypothetical protein